MTEAQIRAIVRDEIFRATGKRRPRPQRCGTANVAPNCWASAVYGSEYCRCVER